MAKPWKVKHLDPDKRLAPCLKKILRTRMKEVFSYQSSALTNGNVEAVHDMRVAVRRLTAVLAIFRPCFKKKQLDKYRTELKAVLGALGDMRDGDIFMASIARFRESAADDDRPALDLLLGEERKKRDANKRRLQKTLRKLHTRRFVKKFGEFLSTSLSSGQMKKMRTLEPKKSFRENARLIVPALLDAFLSHRDDVMAHPALKKKLHRMRIDGKRMRYGMETFTDAFGNEYEHCLEEVKTVLDVMGVIHDCDMNIPKLRREIRKAGIRNRRASARQAPAVRTQGLAGLMKELEEERSALFHRMGERLRCWEQKKFPEEVERSM